MRVIEFFHQKRENFDRIKGIERKERYKCRYDDEQFTLLPPQLFKKVFASNLCSILLSLSGVGGEKVNETRLRF